MKNKKDTWALFDRIDIINRSVPQGHPERVLLNRYRIIKTPLFGWYLHHHRRPDSDRDCHDHPWQFRSLILRGGYSEVKMNLNSLVEVSHTYWPGDLRAMRLWEAHRITSVRPNTWTMLFVGHKRRDWGFWRVGAQGGRFVRFIPWQSYVNAAGQRTAGPDPFND